MVRASPERCRRRFVQTQIGCPSEPGSGRGLAIARKAVELQGSSMDIRVDPEGTDVAIRSAASMT